jgi:hypothetical protein
MRVIEGDELLTLTPLADVGTVTSVILVGRERPQEREYPCGVGVSPFETAEGLQRAEDRSGTVWVS